MWRARRRSVRYHEEKERLLAELLREIDPKKRRALIERIQAVFYEDVGRMLEGEKG